MMFGPNLPTSVDFGAAVVLAAILAAILTDYLAWCLAIIRDLRHRRNSS
ncbi:MAG: hypothetical protein VXZ67_05310 [Pseudomonadota bacterium]|nr:hypothetical protein [Pseudomonadota bacterium]